jgi:TonB family protein
MKMATDESVPQLLFQYPLPAIPETINRMTFDLDIVLFILTDGTVDKVRILKGSGDNEWDLQAMESIKKWRFTSARMNNQPISTWYHLRSTVRYASPKVLSLAEILCTTAEEADTVYKALGQGSDFSELAMRYSVDPSREMKGILGEININMYPENIREVLGGLDENEYTKPVKYGDLHAIFKRLQK